MRIDDMRDFIALHIDDLNFANEVSCNQEAKLLVFEFLHGYYGYILSIREHSVVNVRFEVLNVHGKKS